MKRLKRFFVADADGEFCRIEKSRRELTQVFDGIIDPIAIIESDYTIQRINRKALSEINARQYKEGIGRPCYELLHGLKEKCPQCTAGETFATARPTTRMGILGGKSNASAAVYQISCYPIVDESGNVTAIAEYYRDSTELMLQSRNLYETERRQVMEPLSAALNHQIRQPLTIIRSTTQYLFDKYGKHMGDPDFEESVDSIVENVDAVNDILSDFSNYSKVSSYVFKEASPALVLERGLKLVMPTIKQRKIALRKKLPSDLPPLLLDEKLFLQAYLNLLNNSLDAMSTGGSLAISAFRDEKSNPENLVILIQDTGRGVPKELIPKIFQPLYSTKPGGVGLGLAISESIIRFHGGKIVFESQEQVGTSVRIEIPRALRKAA